MNFKGKKKYLVTNETLRSEILESLKHAERFGKHTDKLGCMFHNFAMTVILKNVKNMDNLPDYVYYDMLSEMIVELIVTTNRLNEEKIKGIDNMFNYLYSALKFKMYKIVTAERERVRVQKAAIELVKHMYPEGLLVDDINDAIENGNFDDIKK